MLNINLNWLHEICNGCYVCKTYFVLFVPSAEYNIYLKAIPISSYQCTELLKVAVIVIRKSGVFDKYNVSDI